MKIEELLRKIIDISTQDQSTNLSSDDSPAGEEGVFMPPLQMNIELMKKSAGVDNDLNKIMPPEDEEQQLDQVNAPVTTTGCGCGGECQCQSNSDGYEDERQTPDTDAQLVDPLDAIKKNAGLPVTVIHNGAM